MSTAPPAPDFAAITARQRKAWRAATTPPSPPASRSSRSARRRRRPALGHAGAGRRRRQRQHRARRRPLWLRRRLARLRPRAARPRGRRAAAEGLPWSSSRATPRRCPSRTPLRRRGLGRRRDVRARPAAHRRRDAARLPAGRDDRPRQLDARGLHRRAASHGRRARAAAARLSPPLLWGTEGHVRELLGHGVHDSAPAAATSCSASTRRSTSRPSSASTTARRSWPSRPWTRAAARARGPHRASCAASTATGARALAILAEYLEVVATRD